MGVRVIWLYVSVLFLVACRGQHSSSQGEERDIPLKYASALSLREGEGYVCAEFRNPWDSTATLHRYVLVPRDSALPARLPEGDVVRIPLRRMLCYVSIHASLFHELGALDAIGAVGEAEYMDIPALQQALREGRVVDCGSSSVLNTEQILDFSPDAVLVSAVEDNSSYARLMQMGIPVIECADYMETGPLARAEWMRFFALLVGKEAQADSLFKEVEGRYLALQQRVQDASVKPVVLDGIRIGADWYVAGSSSTVGQFIADAGGRYVFSDENHRGALPFSPEVVLERGEDADIWMFKYYKKGSDMTCSELRQEWQGYAQLKAFRQHRVYAANLLTTDFSLATPFHPDLLLREYVRILHPEVLEDDVPNTYFLNLAE